MISKERIPYINMANRKKTENRLMEQSKYDFLNLFDYDYSKHTVNGTRRANEKMSEFANRRIFDGIEVYFICDDIIRIVFDFHKIRTISISMEYEDSLIRRIKEKYPWLVNPKSYQDSYHYDLDFNIIDKNMILDIRKRIGLIPETKEYIQGMLF